MKNLSPFLLVILLLLILAVFPDITYAAEKESINPPGWLGGFLAFLSLALAIGAGFYVRNKRL